MKTLYLREPEILTSADRVAFVVCAYHGDDRAAGRSLLQRAARWLRLTALGDNNRRVMSYYANPRDLDYLLALIEEVSERNQLRQRPSLYVDERFAAQGEGWKENDTAHETFSFERLAELRDRLTGERYGAVVLVFADAIGLGCEPLERLALRIAPAVVVLNGRRRVFVLTRSLRRALRLRRVLSRRRVDWLLALVFVPVGALCAAKDALAAREDA